PHQLRPPVVRALLEADQRPGVPRHRASPERLKGKRVIMFVGDSFTAGHGIKNVADRFSDRVGAGLGPAWESINLARCGWCTLWEADALAAQTVTPEVVVLGYFFNDIEVVGIEGGRPMPTLHTPLPVVLRKSYFLNFLYWRWQRSHQMA